MTRLTATLSTLTDEQAKSAVLVIDGPPVKDVTGKTIRAGGRTIPFDSRGRLGEDGEGVDLLATDTPDTEPTLWGYRMQVKWLGGSLPAFSTIVTGEAVDLVDLQPMNPVDPVHLPPTFGLERVLGLDTYVQTLVEDAVEEMTPGTELAYVETYTPLTSANTTPFAAYHPELLLSTVGTGRPIDLELHIPAGVWHTTANRAVTIFLYDGTYVLAQAGFSSPSTVRGAPLTIKRRIAPAKGQVVNIIVGVYCATGGGNFTLNADFTSPACLSAVAR